MITVYTKRGCVQCVATFRDLQARGIPYRVIDLGEDVTALAHVEGLGYRQVPVVEVSPSRSWCGYRPDLIAELAREMGR